MSKLCEKVFELYKEFENSLPENWFSTENYFNQSREIQFEADCSGWLTYGFKFITSFNCILLMICRYGGGEDGAYSIDYDEDIEYAIDDWLDNWDIDEDSVNFEFIHIND